MAPPDRDDVASTLTEVATLLGDDDRSQSRLKRYVELLDAEEEPVRIAAAWACCMAGLRDATARNFLLTELQSRGESTSRSVQYQQTATFLAGMSNDHPKAPSPPTRHVQHIPQEPDSVQSNQHPSGGTGQSSPSDTTPDRTDDSPDVADDLDVITAKTGFSSLHVAGGGRRGRFGESYNALVSIDDSDAAVTLRFLQLDDGLSEGITDEAISAWRQMGHHPNVVEVLEAGHAPRPWLVTEVTGERLIDRGRAPPERALADGRALASGLAHIHASDIVHGGLDPWTVVYPGGFNLGGEPERPQLDAPGILPAIRREVNPADFVDPRYAAPEYFDRKYGSIDNRTDIYHLGAVLYRLYTGSPPYRGRFAEVREAVLSGAFPEIDETTPTAPAVNDLLATALATDKLRRYETAEQFGRAIARVEEEADGE